MQLSVLNIAPLGCLQRLKFIAALRTVRNIGWMFCSASSQYSVRVSFYPFGYCNNLISRNIRVPPQCEQGHNSSGMLLTVSWKFVIDGTGQPPVHIFSFIWHPRRRHQQAVQKSWKLTTGQYCEIYLKRENLKPLLSKTLYGNFSSKVFL